MPKRLSQNWRHASKLASTAKVLACVDLSSLRVTFGIVSPVRISSSWMTSSPFWMSSHRLRTQEPGGSTACHQRVKIFIWWASRLSRPRCRSFVSERRFDPDLTSASTEPRSPPGSTDRLALLSRSPFPKPKKRTTGTAFRQPLLRGLSRLAVDIAVAIRAELRGVRRRRE